MAEHADEWADMTKVGRGVWFVLHNMGVDAITYEDKVRYADFARYICSKLRCVTCGGHCASFLQSDIGRPEKYFNFKMLGHEDKEVGCAYHSFLFHNAANKHAGHEVLTDFWEWYESFTGGSSCTSCGSPPPAEKPAPKVEQSAKAVAMSRIYNTRPLK